MGNISVGTYPSIAGSGRGRWDCPDVRWKAMSEKDRKRDAISTQGYETACLWGELILLLSGENLAGQESVRFTRHYDRPLEWMATSRWIPDSPSSLKAVWDAITGGRLGYDEATVKDAYSDSRIERRAHDIYLIYEKAAAMYRQAGAEFPKVPDIRWRRARLWKPYLKWMERCRIMAGADEMLDSYFSGIPIEYVLG